MATTSQTQAKKASFGVRKLMQNLGSSGGLSQSQWFIRPALSQSSCWESLANSVARAGTGLLLCHVGPFSPQTTLRFNLSEAPQSGPDQLKLLCSGEFCPLWETKTFEN